MRLSPCHAMLPACILVLAVACVLGNPDRILQDYVVAEDSIWSTNVVCTLHSNASSGFPEVVQLRDAPPSAYIPSVCHKYIADICFGANKSLYNHLKYCNPQCIGKSSSDASVGSG